jgi:hypothetical protein
MRFNTDDSIFLHTIVNALMVSPSYVDEKDKLFEIELLRLVFDKLDVQNFMDDYDVTQADYEEYFKGIMNKEEVLD